MTVDAKKLLEGISPVELVRDLNYLEQAEAHGDEEGAKFGEPAARAFLQLALKYARFVNSAALSSNGGGE